MRISYDGRTAAILMRGSCVRGVFARHILSLYRAGYLQPGTINVRGTITRSARPVQSCN